MLRNSQYFNLELLKSGSKTVVLAGNSYSSLKLEIGSTVLAKYNSSGVLDYFIEDNDKTSKPGKLIHRIDLQSYVLKDWKMNESFPVQYTQEPKIKTSILRNHFREVHHGELLNIQITSNEKYDHYKHFSTTLLSKAFLFKIFEGETLMFLGSNRRSRFPLVVYLLVDLLLLRVRFRHDISPVYFPLHQFNHLHSSIHPGTEPWSRCGSIP